MNILGIDIGGSGVKGAPVDLVQGEFATERLRIETPQPSTPEAVAQVVKEIVDQFGIDAPFGCTFPAVVQHGVTLTAANVDKSWIGTNAQELFQTVTGRPLCILNDGDAAGVAEMKYGAGRNRQGVVIMLTFGTGIGSAIFVDGHLLPNTEFGHVEMKGGDAEHYASAQIRKDEDLSWKKWAARVDEYLHYMEMLFSPDLFIIGGGVSKRHEKFLPRLTVRTDVVPAQLLNDAGIIGAALMAKDMM
ncbi:ROK family protein [Chloroflexi bacterium TSY]|nr:ROK family protein [Chloroflexi bacterium TSY]